MAEVWKNGDPASFGRADVTAAGKIQPLQKL
jgi:hypothetical protein